MIIAKTPYRISFFGGGTDYPKWYLNNGGSTLVTTIDRYCYLACRFLPPFFEHKHRIVYSNIELVNHIQEIQHPSVKGVLSYLKAEKGIEVIHYGDLPARSGIGSSSSFTVGLLRAMHHLSGHKIDKHELARQAIHVEQNIIGEVVGSQDQVAAAYGGLNRLYFKPDGSFEVRSVEVAKERLDQLQSSLLIVFSGFQRNAPDIAQSQVENLDHHQSEMSQMLRLVDDGEKILTNAHSNLDEFGKLLDHGWTLKRALSDRISTSEIDQIYAKALSSGAIGGKLLGAGGGGFMLFYVPPEKQASFRSKMSDHIVCEVNFENCGSHIIE
jgi:D-glycero-alpha-D-manno-heptose-7-phosphate kinase